MDVGIARVAPPQCSWIALAGASVAKVQHASYADRFRILRSSIHMAPTARCTSSMTCRSSTGKRERGSALRRPSRWQSSAVERGHRRHRGLPGHAERRLSAM